jgi:hypothetical protein
MSTITPKNVIDKVARPCLNLKTNHAPEYKKSPENILADF